MEETEIKHIPNPPIDAVVFASMLIITAISFIVIGGIMAITSFLAY